MKNWRTLAALCLIGALIFTFAACTTPTEPSTEPSTDLATEPSDDNADSTEPVYLIDPETFKDFIGTWYADGSSASYRIIINKDATWSMTNPAEEVILHGSLMVFEDNKSIALYDPDGVQALDIAMEEDGKIYVELYIESLMESLGTNYFLNKITNDNAAPAPLDEEGSESEVPMEEIPVDVTPDEGAAPEDNA